MASAVGTCRRRRRRGAGVEGRWKQGEVRQQQGMPKAYMRTT
jgi:hypothetical protein